VEEALSHLGDCGSANEPICYDHDKDKTLFVGIVKIERMLRKEEKGNIIVLAHIELAESQPAQGAHGRIGPGGSQTPALYLRTSAIG
jgi:hypothetical protein